LEKLCEAQFKEVFHELANASLNFERKCFRASASDKSKTWKNRNNNESLEIKLRGPPTSGGCAMG
jgi:hypothetical protein